MAFPRVTSIIKRAGLVDYSAVDKETLDAAARFGRAVHVATALDDADDLDEATVDPPLRPYLEAWRKFKADHGAHIIEIERPVESKRWKFQGTLDRTVMIRGRLGVIDIKSSAAVDPWVALQTAAYAMAFEEETGRKIRFRLGVQLRADGTYRKQEFKDAADAGVFLSCATVAAWKAAHMKGADNGD